MPISDYLLTQYPNCKWSLGAEDYNTLIWYDDNPLPKPSKEELIANKDFIKPSLSTEQIAIQEAATRALQYRNERHNEYPSIGDQLDALWKGGDAAAEMLAKVQAVKAKYPKPQ